MLWLAAVLRSRDAATVNLSVLRAGSPVELQEDLDVVLSRPPEDLLQVGPVLAGPTEGSSAATWSGALGVASPSSTQFQYPVGSLNNFTPYCCILLKSSSFTVSASHLRILSSVTSQSETRATSAGLPTRPPYRSP